MAVSQAQLEQENLSLKNDQLQDQLGAEARDDARRLRDTAAAQQREDHLRLTRRAEEQQDQQERARQTRDQQTRDQQTQEQRARETREAYEQFLNRSPVSFRPQTTLDVPRAAPAALAAPAEWTTVVRDTPDMVRQRTEQAALRDLLMKRIEMASAPVDLNTSGVKELLATQRLSRQRAAERQRSQLSARLSSEGLLDSGAFDTGVQGIEQMRGEGESADIAEAFGGEHRAKRQELLALLQQAIAMGDSEAIRTLQQQLAESAAVENRRQFDVGQAERMRQFDSDARFRTSSFLDQLRLQMQMAERR